MGEVTGKLAQALSEALVTAHAATVDDHHAKVDEARTAFMERGEREIAAIWRDKGLPDFTDPHFSDAVKAAYASIHDPQNQMDFFFSLLGYVSVAVSGGFAAASGLVQQITNRSLHAQGDAQPDVGTIAAADNQGLMAAGDAENAAQFTGYRPSAYELIRTIGESWPALGEIFAMAHRGMPESEVDTMLRRQGYPIAVATLLKDYLLEGPPSAEAAIVGRLKGHLTDAQASAILAANGIDPANLEWLRASAGRPPGIQEMTTLWRRGATTQERLEAAVRQSDINDDFMPEILAARYHSLPFRSIVSAFTKKSINEATARLWLDWVGILPEQVDAIIKTASTGATAAVKTLSATEMIDLYEVGHWTADQAKTELVAHGYDAEDADQKIFLADERKAWARKQSAANRIGTAYTGWKIDRTTATQQLDAVGIPPTQRDDLLSDWDAVRAARTAHLTRADIHKAVNAEKMTHADGIARLRAMGYDEADADLIPFIDKWSG